MIQNVVYFTDTAGLGGAEQSMMNLIRGLDRTRFRPTLIHRDSPELEPLNAQARRYDVPALAVPLSEGTRAVSRLPQLARTVRSLDASIFHAHLTWPSACREGLLAATLARVPVKLTTVHLFVDIPYGVKSRLVHRALDLSIDRHIAVSHALAASLSRTFRLAPEKLAVVHNGIPTEDFDREPPAALRAELQGGTNAPVVLCLARLDAQKGIHFLLEAARGVAAARFVFVGDGPDRQRFEKLARELGVAERVTFLGQRRDVPDLLAASDVFVLPSLWEGLPLSILEAMAAGKPVIATEVGGTPEALTDGETGLLVAPSDPAALTTAIRRVLEDADLRSRLASQGRDHVRRAFSVQAMVRAVTAHYDELLGARGVPARAPLPRPESRTRQTP